jgi:cobalt/nickel transport protein
MKKDRKGLYVFIAAGVALSIALAVAVSPFASSSPDGLEKVAEDKGFARNPEGLSDKHPAWSTALSGLLGTVSVLLLAWGLALVLKKKQIEEEEASAELPVVVTEE